MPKLYTGLGLALGNLVENAIKYAGYVGSDGAAGDGRVRVETGVAERAERAERAEGSVIWARVQDNGPGIASEHLPHLFERFYRADAARTRAGTAANESDGIDAPDGSGLGLAIAGEIVRAHGGTIRVESVVGCGSAFTLELPAA